MKIHEKLYQLRKEKNITQTELAEIVDVSRQAVSRWEMGVTVPSIDKIIQLCELYGVSTDYLLIENNSMDTPEEGTDHMKETDSIELKTENGHKFFTKKFILLLSIITIVAIIIDIIYVLQSMGTLAIVNTFMFLRVIIVCFVIRLIILLFRKWKGKKL